MAAGPRGERLAGVLLAKKSAEYGVDRFIRPRALGAAAARTLRDIIPGKPG